MALLGKAALAMWWDVASDVNAEFQDWHSHEHFRERLAVPGFRRATRWSSADGGEGVFQIYEVDGHEVLSSPQYLAHLNSPTPWSTRLMPHHRNMVRSQCHVLASSGAGLARHALVIRLSPEPGQDAALLTGLTSLLAGLPDQPGCVGAHVLRHEAPAIAQTTEQKLRGNDRFADRVVMVVGYDLALLQQLAVARLGPQALADLGAQATAVHGFYTLSFSATAGELG